MENLPYPDVGDKKNHPVAQKIEMLIRQRLAQRREELGLSDDALGSLTFRPLGFKDGQKKANNLLRGQTRMLLSEFYILCEGLKLPPDRVFTAALDDALAEIEKEGIAEGKALPPSREVRRGQEKRSEAQKHGQAGSIQPSGNGASDGR